MMGALVNESVRHCRRDSRAAAISREVIYRRRSASLRFYDAPTDDMSLPPANELPVLIRGISARLFAN